MCAADMLFGIDIGGASAGVVPQPPRPRCSSHSKCGGEGGRGADRGQGAAQASQCCGVHCPLRLLLSLASGHPMCMACYWRAALGKLQAVRRRVARIGSFEDATHSLHSAAFTIIKGLHYPQELQNVPSPTYARKP
jgi:hypothetical protein